MAWIVAEIAKTEPMISSRVLKEGVQIEDPYVKLSYQ